MMTTISLNENWRFKKENGDWESVTIPHSWNGKDGQDGTGMWRGKGIYERTIVLDDSDLQKPLFLEVNAAAVESTVYINGKAAYTNKCPYSMYRIPLNEYAIAGDNQVCIEVDNAYNDLIYPQMADFSFYGGLYRDVNLIVGDRLSFDYLDGSRDGVYISAENIGDKNWEMRVQGTIVNAGESGDVSVYCILRDADEVICEKSVEFMVENREDFSLTVPVENPHLWQGRKDPYLYTVQVLLIAGGNVIDSRVIPFGFRKIEISAEKGFFLNGEHIKLRGMARHQDFAEVGNAVTKEHMQKDMELLLELGA
ncbi:MAG: beta-galactosidase, partial [Lachnospiraceae bacterium]|nr:beta-galactosidase [Lachnospiraceae bacterium]